MKSFITVFILSVVSLAFTSASFAAEKKGGGKKAAQKEFTGLVETCDAGCIKVKGPAESKMFVVNDTTMVATANKKEATIGDVKCGDNVTVFFVERGDKLIAKRIVPPAVVDDEAEASALLKQRMELAKAGKFREAIVVQGKLVQLREKIRGPDHPVVSGALMNLAELYENVGNYAKAVPLYERALKIREKAFGQNDPKTASTRQKLTEAQSKRIAQAAAAAKAATLPAPVTSSTPVNPKKTASRGKARGTIHLQCRWVHTTWGEYMPNGPKYNVKTSKYLRSVAVTFSRQGSDGRPDKIKILVHAGQVKQGSDESRDGVATMYYSDKEKLIESLKSIDKRRALQRMAPAEKHETIFRSGDVSLGLTYTRNDEQILPELFLKGYTTLLRDDTDIAAVIRELEAL